MRVESFIGVAVLLAASFLTITSPPSQEHHRAGGSGAGFVHSTAVDGMDITFEISPFQVGVNTFDVSLIQGGEAPSNIQTTFMRFTNNGAGVGPIIETLETNGDGSYSTTGAFLSQQGTWKIDFIAQRTGAYDINYSFEASLNATSVSNGDEHSEHEDSMQDATSLTNINHGVTAIPPSESFTLLAIILSIGVAAVSTYSVVQSKQQLGRTVASLKSS